MDIVNTITMLLSYLTLFGNAAIVALLVTNIAFSFTGKRSVFMRLPIIRYLSTQGMKLAFAVALIATIGSLFFSEVAGYEPCKLCWYQRIFMYPLVLILGLHLSSNDKKAAHLGMVFSALGALVAANHYILQTTDNPGIIPCSTVGYSVSCNDTFVMDFGYITIPMMALTAFVLIFATLYLSRSSAVKK